MLPFSSMGGAWAPLIRSLCSLNSITRRFDAVPASAPAAARAVAVLRVHKGIEAALMQHPVLCSLGAEHWGATALRTFERLARHARARVAPELDHTIAIRELAARPWSERDGAYAELLATGLALSGRDAVLHRIACELHAPDADARALIAKAPAEVRRDALRLCETGCVGRGESRYFVGDATTAEAGEFEPSVALVRALAHAGRVEETRRCLAGLRPHERGRGRFWELVAWFQCGAREEVERQLARAPVNSVDRALVEYVRLEVQRDRLEHGEAWSQRISGRSARKRALRHLIFGTLDRGVVRRDLLAVFCAHAERADIELARCHWATLTDSPWVASAALDRANRALRQQAPATSLVTFPGVPPGAWTRPLLGWLACGLHGGAASSAVPARTAGLLLMNPQFIGALERSLGCFGHRRWQTLEAQLSRLELDWLPDVLYAFRLASLASQNTAEQIIAALPRALAESLREPRELDAALVAGALLDPRGLSGMSDDVRSPVRAAYDLGIALSPNADRRRSVLLKAIKQALARTTRDYELVCSLRSECARRLGAGLSMEVGAGIIQRIHHGLPEQLAALEYLAPFDRQRARAFVWQHLGSLADGGFAALMARLATMGVVTSELAALAAALEREVTRLDGAEAARLFWLEFVQAWYRIEGRPMSAAQLRLLLQEFLQGRIPASPAALLGVVREHCAPKPPRRSLAEFFQSYPNGVLLWQLVTRDSTAGRATAWSNESWLDMLQDVRNQVRSIDGTAVQRWVGALPKNDGLLERLMAGSAPTASLATPVSLGKSGRFELRYLDKQRHLGEILRFADSVPCCFNSANHSYGGKNGTRAWVQRIFSDPLSFCFEVQRGSRAGRQPFGFVFGAYALGRRPTVLLNGIYLKRQRKDLRYRILDAIESHLLAPLGIRRIGVARQNGGVGALPEKYREEKERLVRLRGLSTDMETLHHRVYDDICAVVNRPVEMTLFFADL